MTDPRIIVQRHLAQAQARAQARAIASVQFPRLARLMQEPTAFELGELPPTSTQPAGQAPAGSSLEEVGPLIAWLTEAATQSASAKAAGMLTWAAQVIGERVDEDAPDADQVEGPSLDDVAELCKEFGFVPGNNGALLAADVFRAPPLSPLPMLRDMITAAITRWPAPVDQPAAQPVNVANLMRLTEGVDPFAPGDLDPDHVERLAEIIREVDGKHELGVTILAEQVLAHPGFSGCHDGPVAPAVQGEVDELVAALDADAECVAVEHYDLCNMTADQMRRIAQLLKCLPHA